MSVLNSIMGVASKLGLVKVATVENVAEPTRITTRTISLKDLTKELRQTEVSALAAGPAEMDVPYDQVFAAAGIQPLAVEGEKDPWSIETLYRMVVSPPYKDLPRTQAQPAILTALATKKVDAKELVKDAMARDKAIDTFGTQVFQKLVERRRTRAQAKSALQTQIADLQAQLAGLDDEGKAADRRWSEWWQRKVAYEREMALAVVFLLPEPIVTIDTQMPVDQNYE
jgi:hypothetical protein